MDKPNKLKEAILFLLGRHNNPDTPENAEAQAHVKALTEDDVPEVNK